MYFIMSISGSKIDFVRVDPSKCKDEAYLNALKRLLKFKHQLTIACSGKNPTFYIEVPVFIPTT